MRGVVDVFTSKDVSFNEVKTGNAELLKLAARRRAANVL